jgi:hypothetical protein
LLSNLIDEWVRTAWSLWEFGVLGSILERMCDMGGIGVTISEDGSWLYFMIITTTMTVYKMDEANGDLLQQYEFTGIDYGQVLSGIVFKDGILFVSGEV